MKTVRRRAVLAAGLMGAGAALAMVAKPTAKIAEHRARIDLEAIFPKQFAGWHLDTTVPVVLPSPDAQEVLNRIYSQVVARTYVDDAGQRVMLSVAYGGDQTDDMAVHKPEVCYPSQGFEMLGSSNTQLILAERAVPVRRLLARLGPRYEPITYWITVGDRVPGSGFREKIAQLRYGLRGSIPDGMLVRVSSIDRDTTRAYGTQRRFLEELARSMPDAVRDRVLGVAGPQ